MLEKGGVAMMGAVEEEDETRGMASCCVRGICCCVRGICRKVVDRRGSWWWVRGMGQIYFSIEIFVRKNRSAALVLGRFLVNIFFTVHVPG